MIRTIIIDDEQHCIDRLSALLTAHCSSVVHLMDTFGEMNEGLQAIRKLQPDLVFLDVQLHDKTGFDLLRQIDKVSFDVIFTTAFDKYAVQAFKFSAVDYLLKPVDPDDLQQAVSKLERKISADEITRKFDTLFYNLENMQGMPKRISVPTINGMMLLEVNDIIHCQSNINYTTIFLKNSQKLTVAKTLKEFEDLLCGCNFYRVHNSHLVNLACVKSYHKGKGGYITMTDNSDIEISTRRKEDFLKRLSATIL